MYGDFSGEMSVREKSWARERRRLGELSDCEASLTRVKKGGTKVPEAATQTKLAPQGHWRILSLAIGGVPLSQE